MPEDNDNIAKTREQARVIVERIKRKAEVDLDMLKEMQENIKEAFVSLDIQLAETGATIRELIEALKMPEEHVAEI
ncbi:MAG TPA: hypothetical protein DDY86_02560 [Syntrophaceae bacterium]|nr:hypothetical protein [Syntrophaceae bacterium]